MMRIVRWGSPAPGPGHAGGQRARAQRGQAADDGGPAGGDRGFIGCLLSRCLGRQGCGGGSVQRDAGLLDQAHPAGEVALPPGWRTGLRRAADLEAHVLELGRSHRAAAAPCRSRSPGAARSRAGSWPAGTSRPSRRIRSPDNPAPPAWAHRVSAASAWCRSSPAAHLAGGDMGLEAHQVQHHADTSPPTASNRGRRPPCRAHGSCSGRRPR
jgi:hypothetical protein